MPLALAGFTLQSIPLTDSTALLRDWFLKMVNKSTAAAGVATSGLWEKQPESHRYPKYHQKKVLIRQ
jgi:hypothetical protein